MAACVSVCDYECVLEGLERGVLSVLSHTEKIKVLMARASSNGTLSCVCACVHVCMCACVRVYVCVRVHRAAFKSSLIHGRIIFRPGLSFYLQLHPSLRTCGHLFTFTGCFQAAELHESAPSVVILSSLHLIPHAAHHITLL